MRVMLNQMMPIKQNVATADNRVGTSELNVETMSRKPSINGRWGSSFWKECLAYVCSEWFHVLQEISKAMLRLINLKELIKEKKKESEPPERIPKRRKADYAAHVTLMIDGASAQVRSWSYGNLSKRDALRFSCSVMKFRNESQINLVVAEVGGAVEAAPFKAQAELFNALIDGCKEAAEIGSLHLKGPLLDFHGVPVKANELLIRVQELQLLAKCISRYEDPIAQFRVLTYLKPSNWSKGCGWNQIDDARLLLGVHYHGFGKWEIIRLDERLGLMKKIAPVELQHHETFLPRAPNLRDRANALLEQE